MKVDEDDGYVLVAHSLKPTKQTSHSLNHSLIGEATEQEKGAGEGHQRSSGAGEGSGERKLPAGEGTSVARVLEDGGLDALAGAGALPAVAMELGGSGWISVAAGEEWM